MKKPKKTAKKMTPVEIKYWNEENKTLSSIGDTTKQEVSKKIPGTKLTKNRTYIINEAEVSKEVSPDLKAIMRILEDKRSTFSEAKGKSFNPITIAYMARWGTGKTSKMLRIKEEIKGSFNFLTINLWKFSNQIKNGENGDEFVRAMVNDVFTQIMGAEKSHVKNSTSTTTKTRKSVSMNAMASFFNFFKLGASGASDEERSITDIELKYIDDYLIFLSFLVDELSKETKLPTVIVLDDLDRVDVKLVKTILDSIISFLFVKNIIYILPIDEKHVLEGIRYVIKDKNPYNSLNKYFNYSVRSAYVPSMNKKSMFDMITEGMQKESTPKGKAVDLIIEGAGSSYRAIKDFVNSFSFNKQLINENIKEIKKNVDTIQDEYIAFGVVIQALSPKLIDYLSDDPSRLNGLDKLLNLNKLIRATLNKETMTLDEFEQEELPDIGLIDKMFWANINDIQSINAEYIEGNESQNNKIYKWELENFEKVSNQLKMLDIKNIINNSNDKFKLWIAITLAKVEGEDAISFLNEKYIMDEIFKKFEEDQNDKA